MRYDQFQNITNTTWLRESLIPYGITEGTEPDRADRADSDLHNSRTVEEADSPVTKSYCDLSKPVTKEQNKSI